MFLLCLYTLSVNDNKRIKNNCYCEVKPFTHNVAYNLNRNLWAIGALATEKLQTQCLQKTYCINVKSPFQSMFLPNTCEA